MAADKVIHMCSYLKPTAFRTQRYCLNRAAWVVEYIEPEAPCADKMRTRQVTHRCSWHVHEKFLPKGASGITTKAIGLPESAFRVPTPRSDASE